MGKLRFHFLSMYVVLLFLITGCTSEKVDFQTAIEDNSIESWESFVLKHPKGKHIVEATLVLDSLRYQKAISIDSVWFYEESVSYTHLTLPTN